MNKITRNRFVGVDYRYGFNISRWFRTSYFSRGTYKRIVKRMSRKLKPREMAFDWSAQANIYYEVGNKSTIFKNNK
jgi:hypothetical protein